MSVNRARLAKLAATRPTAVGRLLLLARKDFLARVAQRMRLRGTTEPPAAFVTLLPYIDTEGTRSSELALRAGISKQAAGKTIKQYEDAGLLQRSADSLDGRASLVRLTESGLDLLLQTHRAVHEVEREYERMLGKDGMETLRATLQMLAYGVSDAPYGPRGRRPKISKRTR
jgi:DNA-binding MarR family transcriptional regulator